jgi:hypothetical protein
VRAGFREGAPMRRDRFLTADIPVSMHVCARRCRAERFHALPELAKTTNGKSRSCSSEAENERRLLSTLIQEEEDRNEAKKRLFQSKHHNGSRHRTELSSRKILADGPYTGLASAASGPVAARQLMIILTKNKEQITPSTNRRIDNR